VNSLLLLSKKYAISASLWCLTDTGLKHLDQLNWISLNWILDIIYKTDKIAFLIWMCMLWKFVITCITRNSTETASPVTLNLDVGFSHIYFLGIYLSFNWKHINLASILTFSALVNFLQVKPLFGISLSETLPHVLRIMTSTMRKIWAGIAVSKSDWLRVGWQGSILNRGKNVRSTTSRRAQSHWVNKDFVRGGKTDKA
jgi:hypothetical protein